MKIADSNIALMGGISVLALILLLSGCEHLVQDSGAGDVEEIPLLVPFDAKNCPIDVIQVVESCDARHQAKDTVCREKGKKIYWLAVTGASLPFQRGETPPEFEIVFKRKTDDPIERPRGGQCKSSRNGVLVCKIKNDAAQGTYDYSVVAGTCSLDPRIYVP